MAGLGGFFVRLEAALRIGLEIDRPAVLNQPVIEVGAIDKALADMPIRVLAVGADIRALDRPASDVLGQC